jgi:thiamine pyrophosphate-dependent acetolactate synthase large subunit-like protein
MITRHNEVGAAMDPIVEALARAAGLEKALAEYPDDIAAAAAQALNNAGAVKVPTDPAAEPWPPMRAGVGL